MSRKLLIVLMLIFVGVTGGRPFVGARRAVPELLQAVFAADTTWNFDTSSDYSYDTSVIEVTGGVAKLKDLGVTLKDDSLAEYNSAFVAGDTTRGYSGTAAGADVSLVLETASATLYKPSGTFVSRIFDTASGCGNWQRLNATVINGDLVISDTQFDSGLVGLWHMNTNSSSDTTIADASGNGNTGTLQCGTGGYNTTTAQMWDTRGKLGSATYNCLEFDSTDDYVDTQASLGSSVSNVTVAAWFKISQWDNKGGGIRLAAGGGPSQMYMGVGTSGGNSVDWRFYQTFVGETEVYYSDTNWHYLVGVFNNGVQKLYKDGALVDTDNSDGLHPYNLSSYHIEIGRHDYNGGYFSGLIDEVAIYNRALSASEVMNHYQNANPGTVKFQCRAGSTVGEVESGEWRGPDSTSATFYESTGSDLGYQFDAKRYLQYRMYLQ